MEYREKLTKVIRCKGKRHQMLKAVEELNELGTAIAKYLNLPNAVYETSVTEEMADVEIMLEQMKIILCNGEDVAEVKADKITRTLLRLGIKEDE